MSNEPPVDNSLRGLLEAFEIVECAYVFGSVVRGEAGPLSDVDIALLVHNTLDPQARTEIAAALAGSLQKVDGPMVDVLILNDAPPALRHRVIRDGRLVFSRDEARRVQFEVAAIREFLDFQHVLERYDRAMLARAREGHFGSR